MTELTFLSTLPLQPARREPRRVLLRRGFCRHTRTDRTPRSLSLPLLLRPRIPCLTSSLRALLIQFDLILDTGSSDLWVAGTECTIDACQGITKYNPSASSTFQNASTAFQISYGSGDASGYVASESVALGGATVTNQKFGTSSDPRPHVLKSGAT